MFLYEKMIKMDIIFEINKNKVRIVVAIGMV